MAEKKELLRQEIINLYARYLGSVIAEGYDKLYATKDVSEILSSATNLLIDYAGEDKGEKLIDEICKKYNIDRSKGEVHHA